MSDKNDENTPFAFEKAITSLGEIVESIESGRLSLEESLKVFEEGIRLTGQCQKALSEAEQKVKCLVEKQNQATLTDFEEKD